MSGEYTKLARKTNTFRFNIKQIPFLVNSLNQESASALTKSLPRSLSPVSRAERPSAS
jgi:hypothetical protein